MLESYDDILTVDELCEVLKIGKNAAYGVLNSEELKAFKEGNKWRIPKTELEKYVINRCYGFK